MNVRENSKCKHILNNVKAYDPNKSFRINTHITKGIKLTKGYFKIRAIVEITKGSVGVKIVYNHILLVNFLAFKTP